MGDQQVKKVGEKRPNDHEVENGGASKEPRVDSTDAQNNYGSCRATKSFSGGMKVIFKKNDCAVLFIECSGTKLLQSEHLVLKGLFLQAQKRSALKLRLSSLAADGKY